jgi:hypothetical protein
MNCQKFESVATDLARGQMMEAEVRNDALAHSTECAVCSSLLRNEESLTRGLGALAVDMSSLDAPQSVENRLLEAFRQPKVVVPLPVARNYRRYWLTAVAAMFLIVLGVVAMRWNGSQPEPPQFAVSDQPQSPKQKNENEKVSSSTPQEVRAPQEPKPIVVQRKAKPKSRPSINPTVLQASTGRARNNSVQSNHAEVATEFMPLGYLNPRSLQDGGQIVRVEVPRTTLVSFGLPMNMERYNEKVKADILLGVDGRAQAIRFVQDKREE